MIKERMKLLNACSTEAGYYSHQILYPGQANLSDQHKTYLNLISPYSFGCLSITKDWQTALHIYPYPSPRIQNRIESFYLKTATLQKNILQNRANLLGFFPQGTLFLLFCQRFPDSDAAYVALLLFEFEITAMDCMTQVKVFSFQTFTGRVTF